MRPEIRQPEHQRVLRRQLRKQSALIDRLSQLATQFVNLEAESLDLAVSEALATLGKGVGADRAFLCFSNNDQNDDLVGYEWCRPLSPTNGDSDHYRLVWDWEPLRWRIRKGETVHLNPFQARPEGLKRSDQVPELRFQSLLVIPLALRLAHGGFIGIDTLRSRKRWDESSEKIIRLAGEILLHTLLRRRTEEQLKIQEAFFRKVIDINPNFIFAKDRDGRFILVNQATAELYGTTVPELLGKTDADFNKNIQEIRHFRNDDLEVMTTLTEKFISEESITDAKGDQRYLQTVKRPIIGDDGKAAALLGVATDITERKRAEEDRRQLVLQMQHAQKLESLGVLAGGIAHDFNNLLMGMIGNAGLALSEMKGEDAPRKRVESISTAARRAAELTSQLLAYSGKGQFIVAPVDVTGIVEEMGSLLDTVLSKKARVVYDLAAELPNIQADASQIRQIVMNLLTNASDALEERAGMIRIHTEVVAATRQTLQDMYLDEDLPEGDYVLLEVSDTGVGMSSETLQRIFDPFFTTKFTGRGLGLAAVLGIVRGHRGAIQVRSRIGEGTSFSVLLPVSTEGLRNRGKVRSVRLHGGRENTLVLLVDDEPLSRDVTEDMLKHLGHQVVVAGNGMEALEKFQPLRSAVSLVLLDLTMPVMDGLETWHEIQNINPYVPVMLMSGYSEIEVVQRFHGRQLAGFIQKPFCQNQLAEKISMIKKWRAALSPG